MAKFKTATKTKGTFLRTIRTIYLTLAAVVGLIVFIIGAVGCLNLVFKNVVWPVTAEQQVLSYQICDYYDGKNMPQYASKEECLKESIAREQASIDVQFRNELSNSMALWIIGLPVWLFHFLLLQKDWKLMNSK
jgi:hypothetical protein